MAFGIKMDLAILFLSRVTREYSDFIYQFPEACSKCYCGKHIALLTVNHLSFSAGY